MKCPECSHKLTTKNYDPEYDWYECDKCEGCFTVDEIQGGTDESSESEDAEAQGDRSRSKGAKANRGRGKKRKDASGTDAEIQKELGKVKSKPIAKGKKRRTEIEEDDEAIAEFEKEVLKPKVKQQEKHHRDELDTAQVLGIWQDEIQDIYEELGYTIDEHNARDKALIIWREIHIHGGVTAREQAVPHALCGEHS